MTTIQPGQIEHTFLEQDCTFTHDGHSFESGGSYLGTDENGKIGGILYAYSATNEVGTWDGSVRVSAHFGNTWTNNMGDRRQAVYFHWEGVPMYGIYYRSSSDIVRCRQIKEWK